MALPLPENCSLESSPNEIDSAKRENIINLRQPTYQKLAEKFQADIHDNPEEDFLDTINSEVGSLENQYAEKFMRKYGYSRPRETGDPKLILDPEIELDRIDNRGLLKNKHKRDRRYEQRGKNLRRAMNSQVRNLQSILSDFNNLENINLGDLEP